MKSALKAWSGICSLILLTLAPTGAASQPVASSQTLTRASASVGQPKFVVFAPESHYPPGPASDFMKLFQADAAWQRAASHIQVFEFSTQFFMAVPDKVLVDVVRNLASRQITIGLTLESPRLDPKSQPSCQPRGNYTSPQVVSSIIAKIKRAGGTVGYIALDESLYYGHFDKNAGACLTSPLGVGKQVAALIKLYRAAFPEVRIGDVEPFPVISSNFPGWEADFGAWNSAILRETGQRFAFLDFDFDWRHPAITMANRETVNPAAVMSLARRLTAVARANNLAFGVIYDGNATARTDREWILQAENHMAYIQSASVRPDEAIFQSWYIHPAHSLPETDPSTLAYLVDEYFR